MRSRVLRVVALLCLMLGALSAQVAPVVVTVSPTLVTLPLGSLQLFNATVSDTGNTAVTWSVNGIAGGNATVGTIDFVKEKAGIREFCLRTQIRTARAMRSGAPVGGSGSWNNPWWEVLRIPTLISAPARPAMSGSWLPHCRSRLPKFPLARPCSSH